MRAVKYFVPFWVAALVYVITLNLWGPTGMAAYGQLKAEEERLLANMTNLQRINGELENRLKTLIHDPDTIALQARELGYANSQERFVRIVGLPVNRRVQPDPGQVLSAGKPTFIPDRSLRVISVNLGFGIFMTLALLDFLRYSRRRAGYDRRLSEAG
jgi:cell division protein FtsB